MVSWGRSFVIAIKYLVFAVIWAIVGIVISVLMAGAASFGMIQDLMADPSVLVEDPTIVVRLISAALGLIIGAVISCLGLIASFAKYVVGETVRKELEEASFAGGAYAPPPPLTPYAPTERKS